MAAAALVIATTTWTTGAATPVTCNLTVRGLHAYYVEAGTTPVLVHNCGSDFKSGEADIHYRKHVLGVMQDGSPKPGRADMPEFLERPIT